MFNDSALSGPLRTTNPFISTVIVVGVMVLLVVVITIAVVVIVVLMLRNRHLAMNLQKETR